MSKTETNLTQPVAEVYTKIIDFPEKQLNPNNIPIIDIGQAKQFLELIGGSDATWHFQAFDDNKERKDPSLTFATKKPQHFDPDIQSKLQELNLKGACISVGINGCKGKRSNENITHIRALYVDYDVPTSANPFTQEPLPHIVIQTSPGKYHGYWLVNDCTLEHFPLIQKALAIHFAGVEGADLNTSKPAQCMRLPGFLHQKAGREPFLSSMQVNQGPKLSINDIIDAYDLEIQDPIQALPLEQTTPPRFTTKELLKHVAANEFGDAALYKTLAGGRYCYDYTADVWFKWNGRYWEPDILEGRINLIHEVVGVYEQAAKQLAVDKDNATRNGDSDKAKALQDNEKSLKQRIYALQGRGRISNILKLVAPSGEGSMGLGIKGDKWDQKLYCLPCENGWIDLKTGDFFEGHPSDFISLVAPHEWKGINEPCPTWEAFIDQIIVDENLQPDPSTVKFLQQFLGMSLTGDIKEHKFGVFWGDGRNGKSTLFETLKYILGPLVQKLNGEILLSASKPRDAEAASPGLAELRGKRLCWVNETDEGRRLDISLIKGLTGGDTITARELYKKPFSFQPTHTISLSTNYKPKLPIGPRDPVWDRLILFPFLLRFTNTPLEPHERKKDPNLMEKLKQEAPGIMAWLVKGALEWQAVGSLEAPKNITRATQEYRTEEDVIGQFIGDCCVEGPFKEVQAGKLYKAYQQWCEEMGLRPLSNSRFGDNINKRPNYRRVPGAKNTRSYRGLGLLENLNQNN